MRKIKFRAWSKLDDKYYYRVLVGNTSEDEDQYVCSNVYDGNEWVEFDEHCGVIEQYIGLKDKNGKEIYEGDVVKVEGDGEIYRVEWIRSGFGLEPRYNSPRYPVLGNVELRKKIEVIGNIHENPELLEEEQ
ncbi:hypothetical protein GWK74_02930 [Candidatus Saccharibacteria bacterium oral taxon 488]|nr:hypothetical protein GWK74_02930 [Candidatus Saccharibacteria bacterium oral taxon 488]